MPSRSWQPTVTSLCPPTLALRRDSLRCHQSCQRRLACRVVAAASEDWRRGRDSNPRDACAPNGFQDRRNRPLCHLSIAARDLIVVPPPMEVKIHHAPSLHQIVTVAGLIRHNFVGVCFTQNLSPCPHGLLRGCRLGNGADLRAGRELYSVAISQHTRIAGCVPRQSVPEQHNFSVLRPSHLSSDLIFVTLNAA